MKKNLEGNIQEKEKSDIFDFFSLISKLLIPLVLGVIGIMFTQEYNERQIRNNELKTLLEFMPLLAGEDAKLIKDYSLMALVELGDTELATKIIKYNEETQKEETEGANVAADIVMTSITPAEQERLPKATSTEIPSEPGEERRKEGWIYLGNYVEKKGKWITRYLMFDESERPEELKGKELEVRFETGALNVRRGMPAQSGAFPQVIDVLKEGSEVIINEVRSWSVTGYMWAHITYYTQKK